jgi:lipoprotein NlpI
VLGLSIGLLTLAVCARAEQGGRARNKRLFIVPPHGSVQIDGRLAAMEKLIKL